MKRLLPALCAALSACTGGQRTAPAAAAAAVPLAVCVYSNKGALGNDLVSRKAFVKARSAGAFKSLRVSESPADTEGCDLFVKLGFGQGGAAPVVMEYSAKAYSLHGNQNRPLLSVSVKDSAFAFGLSQVPARLRRDLHAALSGASPYTAEILEQRDGPARRAAEALRIRQERRREALAAAEEETAAGRPRAGLQLLLARLAEDADEAGDTELREKIIALVFRIEPPPEIPGAARAHVERAQAYLKLATSNEDFVQARNSLWSALLAAPWWADAYVNYALVQEKLGGLDWALWALRLSLRADPASPGAAEVRQKVVELEVAKERAARGR